MAKFTDINRLDYIDESEVFIKEKFYQIKKISREYHRTMLEFLIENNLLKHFVRERSVSFAVIRIHFQEIWEWHISENIHKIVDDLGKKEFECCSGNWDCIWMLKKSSKADGSRMPDYFCDIMFFWNDLKAGNSLADSLNKSVSVSDGITHSEILFQTAIPGCEISCLRHIFHYDRQTSLLQCQFAHNIYLSDK